MADINGFKNIKRKLPATEDAITRKRHYKEFYKKTETKDQIDQAARCMDCGVPFCHNGCPLGNVIPDFNDAVYQGKWEEAYNILTMTNNFPEFTGRICPAPCESSCVLSINNEAVAIEFIEKSIVEKAYENGWVLPILPEVRTNKKVAVIGSGPSGLAAAEQLNKAGHEVTVYERNDEAGGLLRYGIPDFKLEKSVVQRRIELMKRGGVSFVLGCNVGLDIAVEELMAVYDAILLCGGSSVPRDLGLKGRKFKGIYFAMEYLEQSNRRVAGKEVANSIEVEGEDVLVIGGGDTGSDCIGTSNRQKAKSVTQLEILGKPPEIRDAQNPWPNWPLILRSSSSHEEGCKREYSVLTKEFISQDGMSLSGLRVVDIEWSKSTSGKHSFEEIVGTERLIRCTKIFLAMGFLHPEKEGLLSKLKVELDSRGNVLTNNYETSIRKVFAAGDIKRGQSLVVWAISEGREAARKIDEFLMGNSSKLEAKEKGVFQLSS